MKRLIIMISAVVVAFILLFSCVEKEPISANELVGVYLNIEGAANYHHLYLKKDFTYHLIEVEMFGDAWFHYFGKWKIRNNTLILYEGEDISEYINVEETTDIYSDTLIVNIDKSIQNSLPEIKYSMMNDTSDFEVVDGKIIIVKSRFWDVTDEKHPDDGSYEFVPLSLNLRLDSLYANIEYIFQNKEITISLKEDFKQSKQSNEVLCKYKKKDNILYSFDESWKIKRNRLVNMKIKYPDDNQKQ